jgi:hypothetical protein
MLNIRLYDDIKRMIEVEGSSEDILRNFFNEMIEEKNLDLSFYQWCKKNLPFKSIGNIYVYAEERLGEQIEKVKKIIENEGYDIEELELEEVEEIIKKKKLEKEVENSFREYVIEEIDNLLNDKVEK